VIERSELHDAAQKAFPADALKPSRDESWKLVAEMGWLMLALPEEAGGLGLARDAAAAIHFEMGKVLCTAPLLPAMATVQALGAASELSDQAGWIERATAGEFITTSLLKNDVVRGEGLGGTLRAVPDADMASHVMIADYELAALVPLDAPGVTVTERRLWDESRRLFDVRFDETAIDPGLVLARGPAARPLTDKLKAELIFAVAADSLGGANAILDRTVEYLKTRKQFDRPLGMFQALQHRCADLKVMIAATEALLWARAVQPNPSWGEIGGLKAHAAEVYRWTCEESIQLHGGVGLTEEFYPHLFMKRANLNVQLGGDADVWRELVGREALAASG